MIFDTSKAFSSSNDIIQNLHKLKTKPIEKELNKNNKNEQAIKLELLKKNLRDKEEIIQKLKTQLKANKNLIKLLSKKVKENKSDSISTKKQKPDLSLKKEKTHIKNQLPSSEPLNLEYQIQANTKDKKKFQNGLAGFDCNKAKKWDERKVCSNKDLAYLDIKLSKVYWTFIGSLKNKEIKNLIVKKQIKWIKSKNKCKRKEPESTNCLKLIYIKQLAWLENQSSPPNIPLKKKLRKTKNLFEILPFENLRLKNQYAVLDKKNHLLWSKLNFFQKVGEMPNGSRECIEWVDQMNREKYGGRFNWRIPTHDELNSLKLAYKNVTGGKFENFKYWGFKDLKKNNLSKFRFQQNSIQRINNKNKKANCRLVSTLEN